MQKRLLLIWSISLLVLLSACQRVINLHVNNASSFIVIEGNITNITGTQTVTISKTVGYSDANVYPVVTGAQVSINTGVLTYALKETKPGLYTINNYRAKTGQTYLLSVKIDDKTYTASSTMPTQVTMDSLGINNISVGSKSVRTISVFYHDPANMPNQYRFVLYVNGVQVKDVFAVNDDYSNGRIVNTTLYQDDIELKTGDKIEVEMQCIDKSVYNYWYGLSQQGGNGPNNSATPSNPVTNISNGALGYFSVHTSQRKNVTVL